MMGRNKLQPRVIAALLSARSRTARNMHKKHGRYVNAVPPMVTSLDISMFLFLRFDNGGYNTKIFLPRYV
jgi:hypothetical protein